MQAWFGFYSVIGTAAATLTGLLFVALSVNAVAALQPGPEGSMRFAEQAFENYLVVLMVSLLAVIPEMSLQTFGRIALLVTASWTALVLVRFYQAARQHSAHETRFRAMQRHFLTLIGFGLLIVSAGQMARNGTDMRNMIASATIVLLFSATERAWALLKRIAVAKK